MPDGSDEPEKRIKHSYTDEIVCPFCGYEWSDSGEMGDGREGDIGKPECPECERKFFAYRNVEVTYSTMIPCVACEKPLRPFLDDGPRCKRTACIVASTEPTDV